MSSSSSLPRIRCSRCCCCFNPTSTCRSLFSLYTLYTLSHSLLLARTQAPAQLGISFFVPSFVRNFRTIFQIFALCFLFSSCDFDFVYSLHISASACVCVFIYLSHILRPVRVICLINVRKKELFGAVVVAVSVVVNCYCWRFLFASSYLILHIVATFCFCFGFPSHCLSRLVFFALNVFLLIFPIFPFRQLKSRQVKFGVG